MASINPLRQSVIGALLGLQRDDLLLVDAVDPGELLDVEDCLEVRLVVLLAVEAVAVVHHSVVDVQLLLSQEQSPFVFQRVQVGEGRVHGHIFLDH